MFGGVGITEIMVLSRAKPQREIERFFGIGSSINLITSLGITKKRKNINAQIYFYTILKNCCYRFF
jgi:hypothetical protein